MESDRKVDGTSQYDVREEEGVLVECASIMLQLDDVPTESESAAAIARARNTLSTPCRPIRRGVAESERGRDTRQGRNRRDEEAPTNVTVYSTIIYIRVIAQHTLLSCLWIFSISESEP